MSEYIIEWFDIGGQLANLLNGNVALMLWPKKIREERLREKIVRCRDCKFCHKNYCEKMTSPTVSPSEIFWVEVTPDGFCKWGVKK